MDCKYVISYKNDPVEYFNDSTELDYFLAIHCIEHGIAFEFDPKCGLRSYYTFADKNYRIVDLETNEECRFYYGD